MYPPCRSRNACRTCRSFVDPSHAAGKRPYVAALSLAAVAAGADGLMIEVHPNPDQAMSDGMQSLNFAEFADLMPRIAAVAQAVGKTVTIPAPELAR